MVVLYVYSISPVVLDNRLPGKKTPREGETPGWAFSKFALVDKVRAQSFSVQFFVAQEFVFENSPSEGLLTKDSTFASKEINTEWAIVMPSC